VPAARLSLVLAWPAAGAPGGAIFTRGNT